MSQKVLSVEEISKLYRLGSVSRATLKQDMMRGIARLTGKEDPYMKIGELNDRTTKSDSEYVWALNQISFSVNAGDSLGLIGRNGAGKSTLLKILSRVTQPTTGEIKMKGRVASLLEVGTGFHPELTGKENIYLNGAILGMRKWEITNKLDEIVGFSGVERYLDTPVKRYSSGMYVRLAFAVAAHLESEIIILDEVLAVGDAEFQKKCLGKMGEVSSNHGRTVLFVSHNMAAVKSLCTKAIVLDSGKMIHNGDVNSAVTKYLVGESELINFKSFHHQLSGSGFRLTSAGVKALGKEYSDVIIEGEQLEFTFDYEADPGVGERINLSVHLKNSSGATVFSFSHIRDEVSLLPGKMRLTGVFPKRFLNVGQYYISILVVEDRKKVVAEERDVLSFVITMKESELGTFMGREPGDIKPGFEWTIASNE